MHGLCHGLPVRCPVRQAHRRDAASTRAARSPRVHGQAVPSRPVRDLPLPQPTPSAGRAALAVPAVGSAAPDEGERTARAAAGQAARDGRLATLHLPPRGALPAARAVARAGTDAAESGSVARVRPAHLLRRRERRDRARAGRRGLRRGHPARARVLRRDSHSLRPRGRSRSDGAAVDRCLGAGRRRDGGGQCRRLWRGAQGVRPLASR